MYIHYFTYTNIISIIYITIYVIIYEYECLLKLYEHSAWCILNTKIINIPDHDHKISDSLRLHNSYLFDTVIKFRSAVHTVEQPQ